VSTQLNATDIESKGSGARNVLPYIPFLLFAFGVVVRCVQYLHYRALFHDEAVLASNVLDRSFRDLFLPYGNSMAPERIWRLRRRHLLSAG
jgi:hypothetical protein